MKKNLIHEKIHLKYFTECYHKMQNKIETINDRYKMRDGQRGYGQQGYSQNTGRGLKIGKILP